MPTTNTKANEPRHELSFNERFALKEALRLIGEAVFTNREYEYQAALADAHTNIEKARLSSLGKNEFTEDEAELSRGLHTFMRKFMDGPLSSLLWQQISNNTNNRVWQTLIRNLSKAKLDSDAKRSRFRKDWAHGDGNLIRLINYVVRLDNMTREEQFLENSLKLWDMETFVSALETFYEGNV